MSLERLSLHAGRGFQTGHHNAFVQSARKFKKGQIVDSLSHSFNRLKKKTLQRKQNRIRTNLLQTNEKRTVCVEVKPGLACAAHLGDVLAHFVMSQRAFFVFVRTLIKVGQENEVQDEFSLSFQGSSLGRVGVRKYSD